ncbi:MAG: FAD-dependent oxidoreductase [Patescibacteria group bacterium]
MLNTQVSAIIGDDHVTGVRVKGEEGETAHDAGAIIVAIGFEPHSQHVAGVVDIDPQGRITIDHACRTSADGIFAAGDCTNVPYQQIVISAGEGAKAALSAYRYLQEKDGKRVAQVDWGYV